MTEPNYGLEQAKAQYSSIKQMVAALEVDYARLEELKEEFESDMPEDDRAEWIKENCVEFADLQSEADFCADVEDAMLQIQEDPLSVQVRSGWVDPGTPMEAEEFEILLATGGPAVRIRGELDEHGEPCTARMEWQDWGTPWTPWNGADEAVLLRYASNFYFGG